ncbi:MAG: trypsin-like peptidase domain-containing protein [Planctomycetota bacterium]
MHYQTYARANSLFVYSMTRIRRIDFFRHCLRVLAFCVSTTNLFTLETAKASEEPAHACVKVSTTRASPVFYQPWRKEDPVRSSSSGVIVSLPDVGNGLAGSDDHLFILTNAHVTQYAQQIYVQFEKSNAQHEASLVASAPGIDLALIRLKQPDSVAGYKAVAISSTLPNLRDKVHAYGFPIGGKQMSVTEGIVSRIEVAPIYFGTTGVRLQIDAALNPGNSGGPALVNGKLVGLGYSVIRNAENIGYLIASTEIQQFLKDVTLDGTYSGKPELYDVLQSAENTALRAKLVLPEQATGLIVDKPFSDDESYPLKRWDLITHVGNHRLDNKGFVQVNSSLSLSFRKFVPELIIDGKVPFKILRNREELSVQVPAKVGRGDLISPIMYGAPEYAILGPMVFSSPTREMVASMCGSKRHSTLLMSKRSPLLSRVNDRASFPGEELVFVPCPMFPHSITLGYGNPTLDVLKSFNGKRIKNLQHLVELYRDSRDDFLQFEFFDQKETLVFRREELLLATEQILESEGIRFQFSKGLRSIMSE